MDFSYTVLIPLVPLAVFLLLGMNYTRIKPPVSGWIGSLGLLVTLVLSYYTAYQYFFSVGKIDGVYQTFTEQWRWMTFTDALYIDMGVMIDQISVMMLVVVSTISFMVHVYSTGYMKGDTGYTLFFAFLSLFTFSMMGLNADNFQLRRYVRKRNHWPACYADQCPSTLLDSWHRQNSEEFSNQDSKT